MFKYTFKKMLCIFGSLAAAFGLGFGIFYMLQDSLSSAWVFVRMFCSFFIFCTVISIIFAVLYILACNPNSKIGKQEQEQLRRLKTGIRTLELQIESLAKQINAEEYYNMPSKADIDDIFEINKIIREYNLIIRELQLKLLEKNRPIQDVPQDNIGWTCTNCGTLNSSDSNFCKNCGKQKF